MMGISNAYCVHLASWPDDTITTTVTITYLPKAEIPNHCGVRTLQVYHEKLLFHLIGLKKNQTFIY